MGWHTSAIGPDTYLIQNGNVVVGSINGHGDTFSVEVLWGGPGGDIKSDFSDYLCALAFMRGVEAMMTRITAT